MPGAIIFGTGCPMSATSVHLGYSMAECFQEPYDHQQVQTTSQTSNGQQQADDAARTCGCSACLQASFLGGQQRRFHLDTSTSYSCYLHQRPDEQPARDTHQNHPFGILTPPNFPGPVFCFSASSTPGVISPLPIVPSRKRPATTFGGAPAGNRSKRCSVQPQQDAQHSTSGVACFSGVPTASFLYAMTAAETAFAQCNQWLQAGAPSADPLLSMSYISTNMPCVPQPEAFVMRTPNRCAPRPLLPPLPLLHNPCNSIQDVLSSFFKYLGFQQHTTLHLALHCSARLEQMPVLATALLNTRMRYAVVVLWLAAKLEERRMGLAGGSKVAAAIGGTVKEVAVMELQLLQLLDWSPYRGFQEEDEILTLL